MNWFSAAFRSRIHRGSLPIFPVHILQAIVNLVNNAQPHLGVRVNSLDHFRLQDLETIHTGDEAVFHLTGLQIAEHAEPELRKGVGDT